MMVSVTLLVEIKTSKHAINFTEVSVSIPTMINVAEGDRAVLVCSTLSAIEDTERDFTVMLVSRDVTGI